MTIKFKLLIFLLSGLIFQSCEKTILLDLDQAPSSIVIEGTLTNENRIHKIKLSRSLDFYQSGAAPRVTDATVYISDDLGNRFDFLHNPEGLSELNGTYFSEVEFAGVIGRTYTLHITSGNESYTAADELLRVTTIDSLSYRLFESNFFLPLPAGKEYEVLVYAKEPQETKDYYFFKFYRNDSLIYASSTDIYFADDLLLGENIDGLASPILYAKGDVARVEMYSLTRNGYLFYNDLFNLLNNDGGMFGSPPVNPRTNLSNNAMGFFQVSAVEKESISIE